MMTGHGNVKALEEDKVKVTDECVIDWFIQRSNELELMVIHLVLESLGIKSANQSNPHSCPNCFHYHKNNYDHFKRYESVKQENNFFTCRCGNSVDNPDQNQECFISRSPNQSSTPNCPSCNSDLVQEEGHEFGDPDGEETGILDHFHCIDCGQDFLKDGTKLVKHSETSLVELEEKQ